MNISLKAEYPITDLSVDGFALDVTDYAKYLGVYLDKHLNFNCHETKTVAECNSKLYFMRYFKQYSMNKNELLLFYTTNIRSSLTYGAIS